jgi:hypothetical protein
MTQQYNSHDVDWAAAEEKLVREATTAFREIAVEYRDDELYGVCFECDLVYTAVQAHANTNEGLREYAKRFDTSPDVSIDEQIELARWDVGGWHYFPIFETPDFADIAEAFRQLVQKVGGHEAEMMMKDDMMEMACRAVVRLERAGVFDSLRRTPEFRVLCIYREPAIEPDEVSTQRLNRVRESLGSA